MMNINTGAYGSGPSGPSNPNWRLTDASYGSGAAVGNTGAWGSPPPSPSYTPTPTPTSVSSSTPSYFGTNSGEDWSGVAGGGGCFVTTAAYGSPHHPMVEAFRGLCDEVLVNHKVRRVFIRWYNEKGPTLAAIIDSRPTLKLGARLALTPIAKIVVAARRTNNFVRPEKI